MKKLIIIGLAALALLIGGVVLYSVLTPKYTTIAAEDTVNISFYGHNGYGTATLSGEYDWTDKMLSDSASELERLRVRTQFKNTVKYTLSDTENLSNGDTVYLTINADNDRLKEYGYFVEEKTVSFTVEGLEELVDFDPFKDLTVNVTGTAPYGTLQFDDRSDQLSGLRIDADKTDRLKNGDVVTFTVRSKDGSNIDEYWAEKGYSLTRTSIEYTVSGVNSYVQSLEEIPEEELAKMKDQSEDLITSSFEKSRPHDSSDCKVTNGKQLISVEYVGCYLFTLKDGFKVGGYNPACKIMLLYKLTATSSEGEFSYYYPTFFEKPMLMQGTDFSVNLADCYGPRNEFVKGNYTCTYTNILGVNDYHYSQKYTGYPDMETFINKNIAPYVEKYTYVTTVENASSDSADAA